jgi:hypothetical protein
MDAMRPCRKISQGCLRRECQLEDVGVCPDDAVRDVDLLELRRYLTSPPTMV